MGPLMLDCAGYELTGEDRDILDHPLVGGVILFSRNYHDKTQLAALVKAMRGAARNRLLIGVDHEGGRVQRFREGFTRLPAMGRLQSLASSGTSAEQLASACGHILAHELRQLDVDLSFGPVLDVDGVSTVIGDRAFATDPDTVVALATALIEGMHAQGMAATGKHFPGHGSVVADSHVAIPVDERPLAEISAHDLRTFSQLLPQLDAVMPAHVIYNAVDDQPAGFSDYWLRTCLRGQLGFDGVIFSDDLSMNGASVAGGYPERARQALSAGCDMVLACNNRAGAVSILDTLALPTQANDRLHVFNRRQAMAGATEAYKQAVKLLDRYGDQI